MKILGVILAGGQSSRMKSDGIFTDKFLLPLGGNSILEHVIDKVRDQTDELVLSANLNSEIFEKYNIETVPDQDFIQRGPLSGLWAALSFNKNADYILTVSADTPFLPENLKSTFLEAIELSGADIAVAKSCNKLHPTVALWSRQIKDDLFTYLQAGNTSSMLSFIQRHKYAEVSFPHMVLKDGAYADPFFNINTKDDLEQARLLLEKL